MSSDPVDTTSDSQPESLTRIATAAVRLGTLGPSLAALAADMASQSKEQARLASTVAENMQQLTVHLDAATAEMREASAAVEAALATVARIAQHTKIIAINASIEAAHAGVHGVAFGVVVEEVQRLADKTGQTTTEIETRVRGLHDSIARVSGMTGGDDSAVAMADRTAAQRTASVAQANAQMQGIADGAVRQLAFVDRLADVGNQVRQVAEALLVSVGTFRFAAHEQAERELGRLLAEVATQPIERRWLESAMARWIERHPHFELVYFTDPKGRQIVDNLQSVDGRVRQDGNGFGRDWSARPWYLEAVAARGSVSTDLYRSSATGDFCFTISAAVRDSTGQVRGVLGADVNFQQLLAR